MNDNDEITKAALFKAYISMQHVVMIVLVVMMFGLGAGILYQSSVVGSHLQQIKDLMHENTELKIQNIQLMELSKDKLDKIRKGAAFIQRKYNVLESDAIHLATLEMVNAIKHDIPFSLGLAITAQESSFRPDAVSYTNCCLGLKQIHYRVWSQTYKVSRDDLFMPEKNIEVGYNILRNYYMETGSFHGALKRYYGSTDATENEKYAEQVMRRSAEIAREVST